MRFIRGLIDELASSRGVIAALTIIMGGLTLTTWFDAALDELPLRSGLIALSTIACVIGIGVLVAGRTPEMVGWVGGTVMAYGMTRSLLWLSTWSWSGFLAWQPMALLGFLVWQRRQHPYRGGDDERSPATR